MRCSKITRILLLVALVFACGIGGVFAMWDYAGLSAVDASLDFNFSVNTFTYWEGAETLPNEEGESHVELINNLLNGTDAAGAEVGLNNPESALSQNVQNRLEGGALGWLFGGKDYYGSMDGTLLDNRIDMEGVFSTDTLGLSFIIQVKDDLNYYVFTTSVALGDSGAPNVALGELIYPIYRSHLVRENENADFVVVSTEVGSAPSAYYEQLSDWEILHDQTVPSFNVDNWVAYADVPVGTSNANAIWTFVGDTPSASAATEDEVVFYRLETSGARAITCEDLQVSITVKDGDGNVISVSSQQTIDSKIMQVVEFTAEQEDVYYIEVTGSTYAPLTIA